MDTRIEPFGNHPDGGSIKEFAEGEKMPAHYMPLSAAAIKILEDNNVPQHERVSFIINSKDPLLRPEQEWLINKLRKMKQQKFVEEQNG